MRNIADTNQGDLAHVNEADQQITTEAAATYSSIDLTPASNEAVNPIVTFTRGSTPGTPMTKVHEWNEDHAGVVTKSPSFPNEGHMEVVEISLDKIHEAFSHAWEYMILGKPVGAKAGDTFRLVTKAQSLAGVSGVCRDSDSFEFTNLLMLDIDIKDEHCQPVMAAVTADDAIKLIEEALGIPLDNVGMFIKPSASANIRDEEGTPLKQSSGFHIYMALKGVTPAEFHEALHKRLVIAGHGHAFVTASGSILIRTVFDTSVGQPNRVDFFADPVLADDMNRDRKDEHRPGGILDLGGVDLSIDESAYQAAINKLKSSPQVKQLQLDRADQWVQCRAALNEATMPPDMALAKAANLSQRITRSAGVDLYPDDDMSFVFDHGETVDLPALIQRANEFDGMSLADPFDPSAAVCKAKFYANAASAKPCINSFDHGGVRYFLHPRDDRHLHFPEDDDLPCFRIYDEPCGFRDELTNPPGLYEHKWVGRGDQVDRCDHWVSEPLHVTAGTSDMQGRSHGLVLEFSDINERQHRWAMPREMIGDGGDGVLRVLAEAGLGFNHDRRKRIPVYLAAAKPTNRAISIDSTGWAALPDEGPAFVLPDRVIGSDKLIFQSREYRLEGMPSVGGSLLEWQESVACPAIGNPILMMSICVSLAGPLIRHLGAAESGGIHLQGPSSIGKSTCLAAAVSVWGGKDFLRQWRATSNGLEATAAMLNDTALILDEINEVDPKHLGESIYMLANGRGKARAKSDSNAKAVKKWQLAYLSSGEQTPAEYMRMGKARIQAGQEMRLLNVRVDREYGAFDTLHGVASGALFSDQIKATSAKHYGHAGIAFVEKLVETLGVGEAEPLAQRLEAISCKIFESAGSDHAQVGRAAKKFAVFALAGELAAQWNIVPWLPDEATQAAITCFGLWREDFGEGPSERRKILEAVRDFIELHEQGRFVLVAGEGHAETVSGYPVVKHNRVGWIEKGANLEPVYLFTCQGLREATAGFSLRQVVQALNDAGWLSQKGPDGESTVVKRIGTGTHRVYCVKPKLDFS